MSTWLRTLTTVPMVGGLPADDVVITFHFYNPTGTSNIGDDAAYAGTSVHNWIDAFARSSIPGMLYVWASYVNTQGAITQVYDMTEPRPRVPIYTLSHNTVSLPPASGVDFPPEVAIALSYETDRQSGETQARRRGRTYVGPVQWVGSPGTDQRSPNLSAVTVMLNEFRASVARTTAGTPLLSVYSRYNHGGLSIGEKPPEGQPFPENPSLLAESFKPATHLWVDTAWDTQRRRGQAAPNRYDVDLGPIPGMERTSATFRPESTGTTPQSRRRGRAATSATQGE